MTPVDIVIPNFNGVSLLPRCLDSLHRQTVRPQRIIVVDDRSTDRSGELIEAEFADVTVVQLERRKGFCGAVNEGLRRTEAPLVVLLNNDVWLDDRWLAEMVRTMDEYRGAGSAASKILFADRPQVINSAGQFFRVDGVVRDIGYDQPDEPTFAEPRPVFGACAAAAIYRRRALEQVGLFDERYHAYCEDADWAFRALLNGYTCRYVPTAIAYHRGQASYGRERPLVAYYSSRNSLRIVLKNSPTRLILRYALRILAAQCYQVAYLASQGQLVPALRGKLQALLDLPELLAERRHVLAQRTIGDDQVFHMLTQGLAYGRYSRAAPGAR